MSKAEFLKQRFRIRWKVALKREILVYNILNVLLPRNYIVMFTGLGSGSNVYIEDSYNNPLNAFDFTVFDKDGNIAAFIEVTGFSSERESQKGKGLCVGSWKLWKAEKYNVEDIVWFVHVVDERVSLRFIKLTRLKQVSKPQHLEGLPGLYYCCDQSKWGSIKDFLKWLQVKK